MKTFSSKWTFIHVFTLTCSCKKKKGLRLEGANEKSYSGEINSIYFEETRVIKTLVFMNFTTVSSHFSSLSQ